MVPMEGPLLEAHNTYGRVQAAPTHKGNIAARYSKTSDRPKALLFNIVPVEGQNPNPKSKSYPSIQSARGFRRGVVH